MARKNHTRYELPEDAPAKSHWTASQYAAAPEADGTLGRHMIAEDGRVTKAMITFDRFDEKGALNVKVNLKWRNEERSFLAAVKAGENAVEVAFPVRAGERLAVVLEDVSKIESISGIWMSLQTETGGVSGAGE